MIKKLFVLLALFAFVSLLFFATFLLYNQSSYPSFLILPHVLENKKNSYSWKIENNVSGLETSKANEDEIEIQPVLDRTLETCPEHPPNLVGPLKVEFYSQKTLEDIKKEVGSSLQLGGRYKPPDCISKHKVAIIIPFRNRHEHLKHWLYYLHPILKRQQLDYGVYVINQDGEGVFNRAKLMNVGYLEALKENDYECFVFSDVDLVPMDDRNLYKCFDNPRHLAVAMDKFNFHLPYKTFFGGVSSLSKPQFLKINGFPNTYWGWGGEDDDIYRRVIFRGMAISRPASVIGRYRMIKHQRDLHNEPNPENPDKLNKAESKMDTDGLNTLEYIVKETVKNLLYTFITVDIKAPSN